MKKLSEYHKSEYGQKPKVYVNVPTIAVISGQFSMYSKGYMLCGTTDHFIKVGISKRTDALIKVYAHDINERKKFTSTNTKYKREDRWANIIKGVLLELGKHDIKPVGLNITISGDSLKGELVNVYTGIAVGIIVGINKLLKCNLEQDIIARIAYYAQKHANLGVCRYMDVLALLNAKPGTLMLFDSQNLSHIYFDLELNDNYKLYLIESGIQSLPLHEEIICLHETCKETVKEIYDKFGSVVLRDSENAIILDKFESFDEERKRYILASVEQSRVAEKLKDAFINRDSYLLGRYLNENQLLMRDDFEVTCPEVDWLTKRAVEASFTVGATIISTIIPGTIMVLCKDEITEDFKHKLEEYEHIFGFHPQVEEFKPMGCAEAK